MQCATILEETVLGEAEAFDEGRGRKPWGVGWGREKSRELTDWPFLGLFTPLILLLPSETIN